MARGAQRRIFQGNCTRNGLLLFLLLLSGLWSMPQNLVAQDANKAALVIRESDQSVKTACIEFSDTEVTGLELLQQSGFEFMIDVQGLGAAVCSIGQTGCPADDCWCQCKGGGECIYWSYWRQSNGAWQYAQAGALQVTARDGDVQGWSWGPGSVSQAIPPPEISFADVCSNSMPAQASETPTVTPTAVLFAPVEAATNTLAPALPSNTPSPMPTSTRTPPHTPTPQSTATLPPTVLPLATGTVVQTQAPQATMQETLPVAGTGTPTPVEEATVAGGPGFPIVAPSAVPSATAGPTPTPERLAMAVGPELPRASGPARQNAKQPSLSPGIATLQLSVVGSDAAVPDALRITFVEPESENTRSSSPLDYFVFAMLMLGMTALYLWASTRRR